MINKVVIIGNLGKDPEVKTVDGGFTNAKLTVATNESYKDKAGEWQTNTEWHNVTAWRQLASRIGDGSFKKGDQVYIEGKLTHRKYDDKDGITRYVTEVVAHVVRLLGKKESSSQDTGFPEPPAEHQSMTEPDDGSDDLPF